MQPPRRATTIAATWVAGSLLVMTLTGCAGEQPTGSSPTSKAAPGPDTSPTGTAMGADLPAPAPSADWNLADATYLTMMIPHHSQALTMAALAETRAADPRVRAVARAIERGQSREIVVMATWLVDHDLPEPTLEDVEAMSAMAGSAAGMAGMLSPDQLTALGAADGAAFDRLFLTGMIQHHQGAIAMADDQLAAGEDVRATEMATDVVATQSGEIRRMEDLLTDLG